MKFVRVKNHAREEFFLVEDDCLALSLRFHPSQWLGNENWTAGILEYQTALGDTYYLAQRIPEDECEGLEEIPYGCVFYGLEAT